MAQGLHAHAHPRGESLQPLIEQAFRTLAVLLLAILVIGTGVAALYLFTG